VAAGPADRQVLDELFELVNDETDSTPSPPKRQRHTTDAAQPHDAREAAARSPAGESSGAPQYHAGAATPEHYLCPRSVATVLQRVEFHPKHLWEGYHLYCTGSYYKDRSAQKRFAKSTLGAPPPSQFALTERWSVGSKAPVRSGLL
jgi:hypothetical protein